MSSRRTVFSCLLAGVSLALLLSSMEAAADAEASAGSGWWASSSDKDFGWTRWKFSNPDGDETITWTSGENETDDTDHAEQTFGPELEFDPVLPQPLTTDYAAGDQPFDGFTDADGPGSKGSTTATSGRGWSHQYLIEDLLWGIDVDSIGASWSVKAGGSLGKGGDWSAYAEADDPWSFSASDLSVDALDGFDLLYIVFLEDASYSSLGSVRLFTSYETPTETRQILEVTLSDGNASVVGDSSVLFYMFNSVDDFGFVIPTTDSTLSEIETALQADVSLDNSLDSGLYLAIVIPDLTLPASTFADGSFARIHVGTAVADAGASPVPALSPLGLATLFSLLGLAFVRRLRG